MSDLGEIYSNWLALQPGKSIDFELSITPVTDGGGYWSFINSVRRRWGMNRTTMPAPMFWGFARARGADQDEIVRKSLSHLGPVIICIGPWQRLEPDAKVVRAGRYPRLPEGAPRTVGLTLDLDLDAFLTFAHREPYWEEVQKLTRRIHEQVPQAKVIQMIHPAMETIYRPLEDRWPIAPDAIKTAEGKTFEDAHYSRSWVWDMTAKDWGVLYYCPHEGGPQLQAILDGIRRGMDDYGLDGIYSDEFSWAGTSRGYSRYDYSRQDGYSADLDEQGNVVHLKSDNAMASEPSQLQITGEVLKRGKFFLGNGGNVLTSLFKLPIHRFIEGGNGPSRIGQGHLSAVPLILGNMGDTATVGGVFDSVKLCLQQGSIYSPVAVNLRISSEWWPPAPPGRAGSHRCPRRSARSASACPGPPVYFPLIKIARFSLPGLGLGAAGLSGRGGRPLGGAGDHTEDHAVLDLGRPDVIGLGVHLLQQQGTREPDTPAGLHHLEAATAHHQGELAHAIPHIHTGAAAEACRVAQVTGDAESNRLVTALTADPQELTGLPAPTAGHLLRRHGGEAHGFQLIVNVVFVRFAHFVTLLVCVRTGFNARA